MKEPSLCQFEDVPASERRARLEEPGGAIHADGCEACRVFLLLDHSLHEIARRTPPPPSRARWTYLRARLAATEPSEEAAFFGNLIARALGLGGLLLAAVLCARELHRAGGPEGGLAGSGFLLVLAASVAVAFVLALSTYRAWSES